MNRSEWNEGKDKPLYQGQEFRCIKEFVCSYIKSQKVYKDDVVSIGRENAHREGDHDWLIFKRFHTGSVINMGKYSPEHIREYLEKI